MSKYEQTRDTYAGIEYSLMVMKRAVATGDTVRVFEAHRSIISTVEMIDMFVARHREQYDDIQIENIEYELQCKVDEADEMLAIYKKQVA